jgi:hypothetical protein
VTGRKGDTHHADTECHGETHRTPSSDDGLLYVDKREFRAPRAGDQYRKQDPDCVPLTERKHRQAKAEEPDPEQGELHPENRPPVCRLACVGADAEVEEDGQQEGHGEPGPHQRIR